MTDITGSHRGSNYTVAEAVAADAAAKGIDAEAEIKAALERDFQRNTNAARSAEVYSKNNCPYCVRAKTLLAQEGISYTEIDAVSNKETLIERVTQDSGRPPMTVPQIYLDGQYVGGYTELAKLLAAEKNAK